MVTSEVEPKYTHLLSGVLACDKTFSLRALKRILFLLFAMECSEAFVSCCSQG